MLKRNNLPRPLGRLTLMVFLWLPMNSCWLLCHTSLEPWCLSIVFMRLPLHWIHVHVVGHESHGTYSQYQCATKLPISRVTCHLPNQTSIGNSIDPVDVVFFQMHVELKHSSKVFQFLPRVQCVCGQQPLFGSTIWDRAHQAALPTSHKTPQD